MAPLGAKSGTKVNQSGAQREVWKHIPKKTQKIGFGSILGSIVEAKMLQNRPKKYDKKRHSKKRPPGRLAAPFWTISRSFLGGFL